ncbi:hypothetical protein M885DRAFT_232668 [Pelagophyceae sp. CCMP2097]|nr:hypothetical protein M885DRAFT_232668 [Pelagophyceae sp. CCMP2097]
MTRARDDAPFWFEALGLELSSQGADAAAAAAGASADGLLRRLREDFPQGSHLVINADTAAAEPEPPPVPPQPPTQAQNAATQWYVVVGARGCVVREGVSVDTPTVAQLPRGARVSAARGDASAYQETADQTVRVRIDAPARGWCSLKLLAEEPPSDEEVAPAAARSVEAPEADVAALFLSVVDDRGRPVAKLRKHREKVTVVDFKPPPFDQDSAHCWARISEPARGWVPLSALVSLLLAPSGPQLFIAQEGG